MRTAAAAILVALAGCCTSPSQAPPKPSVVRGTVTVRGEVRRRGKTIRSPEGVLRDVLFDEDGHVGWAFVWVKAGLEGRRFEPPSTPVVVEQKGLRYVPHVVGVQVGQDLQIRNRDAVPHAARGYDRYSRAFPPKDESEPVRFPGPKIMEPLRCGIHPWMQAWIGVVGHPFFAITGEQGTFEIPGLPPGRYTIAVWHENLATVELEVVVSAGADEVVDFVMEARP